MINVFVYTVVRLYSIISFIINFFWFLEGVAGWISVGGLSVISCSSARLVERLVELENPVLERLFLCVLNG